MKKSIFLMIPLVVFAIGMISCNQPKPAEVDTKGEQNKAVVNKFLTALRTGDIKATGDQMAANFMSYGPSIKDSSNQAQFIDIWTKRWETDLKSVSYTRYANLAVTIDSTDWVNEWGLINADYKNGAPPIHFTYHGAFRMLDGKIVQYIAIYNVADILEQQGFKFVPPGEQKDVKK